MPTKTLPKKIISRSTILKGLTISGTFLLIWTELISAFSLLSFWPVVTGWLFFAVVAGYYIFKNYNLSVNYYWDLLKPYYLWILPFLFSGGVLLIIVIIAPPNTWDSMSYHLARVSHWISNKTLAPFPTSITRQVYLSPWAEIAIANLQITLRGSDRLALLVQWISFLGVIIATTKVTQLLGCKPKTQWLSAILAIATPTVILQASSTQNDLTCGFWILCAIAFIMEKKSVLFPALAIGLAIATKGTAYIVLFPFLVFFFIQSLRQESFKNSLARWGAMALISITLNAPQYYRNITVFENPMGDRLELAQVQTQSHLPIKWLSNTVRQIAVHLESTSSINLLLIRALLGFHHALNTDIDDIQTSFNKFSLKPMNPHEDHAGNFLAIFLFIFCAGGAIWKNKKPKYLWFTLLTVSSFLFFTFMLKWQPWIARLHTPLFLLVAISSASLTETFIPKDMIKIGMLPWVISIPWLFFNYSKPIISVPTYQMKSIFLTTREDQYFNNRQTLINTYFDTIDVLSILAQSGCKNIGLKLGVDSWEYPFWALSRLHHLDLVFHHVEVSNPTGKLKEVVFANDCAFITIDNDPPKDTKQYWKKNEVIISVRRAVSESK